MLKKAAAGFVWNQVAKITEFFLLFLLGVVTARGLGPLQYGIYVKLMTFATILTLLLSLGMEETISRFFPDTSILTKGNIAYLLRKFTFIRFLITIIACALIYLSRNSLSNIGIGEVEFYWYAIVAYILGLAITNLWASTLYAQLQTQTIFVIRTVSAILNIVGAYILLRLGYAITELIIIAALLSLGSLLGYWVQVREIWHQSPEPFQNRRIWKYGSTLWLLTLLNQILGKQSDILILSYFLVSPAQIGYYNIACGVAVTVKTLLISGLSQVGVPIVVKTCEQDATRLTSVWEMLVKFTALVSLPLLFWSMLFARPLISVLYSDVYVEAALYLQILGLFGLAERLLGGGTSYSVLCVLGKERMVLLMRVLIGITNLILNVFLVQLLGTIGVVLGTGFCNMIIVGIETMLLSQTLPLSYPSRFMFKLLSSVIVGGGCSLGMIYILSPALSIIQLALAGALYFGVVSLAMYLLKPFDPKDIQMASLIDVRLGRIANALGNSV